MRAWSLAFVVGVACTSKNDVQIEKLERYRDALCGCPDRWCAADVYKRQRGTLEEQTGKITDPDARLRVAEIAGEIRRCTSRFR